jgi:sugar phosphate isomerase/epimerase
VLPFSVHMVGWSSTRAGLPAAARLGFRAAEVFALGLWANEPAIVAAWLDEAGMTLSAVFLDLPADPAAAASEAARAAGSAAHFGAARLVVTADGEDFGRVTAAVAAAGAACAAAGVRLCLHPHQHSAIETAAQTDAVLAATDPGQVWVCIDTGHLLAAGDDPAVVAAAWAPRLAAVHLKDIDATGRIVAAGTGRLPLEATLAAIDIAVAAGAPLEHLTLEVEGYDDPGPLLLASAAAVSAAAPVPRSSGRHALSAKATSSESAAATGGRR